MIIDRRINNPPIALSRRNVSFPRVQANKAAKTGSMLRIKEAVRGMVCFWLKSSSPKAIALAKAPKYTIEKRTSGSSIDIGK